MPLLQLFVQIKSHYAFLSLTLTSKQMYAFAVFWTSHVPCDLSPIYWPLWVSLTSSLLDFLFPSLCYLGNPPALFSSKPFISFITPHMPSFFSPLHIYVSLIASLSAAHPTLTPPFLFWTRVRGGTRRLHHAAAQCHGESSADRPANAPIPLWKEDDCISVNKAPEHGSGHSFGGAVKCCK